MSRFWKAYAAVNDDVRHHLIERAWFGREVTADIDANDMPGIEPTQRGKTPEPKIGDFYGTTRANEPINAEFHEVTAATEPTMADFYGEPARIEPPAQGPEPEL